METAVILFGPCRVIDRLPGVDALRILLVEDDPKVAEDLMLLLPLDFDIRRASNSSAALSHVKEDPPQAVILDLCLPPFLAATKEREGVALLAALRDEVTHPVPVIVLSAVPRERGQAECVRYGIDAYLEKPCSIAELVRYLRAIETGD